MAFPGEQVAERQFSHLGGRGLDQLFIAVAQRRAPQPRHALEVGFAAVVVDENPFSPLDDQRPGLAKRRKIGIGMYQRLDIANGEVAEHGAIFYADASRLCWPQRNEARDRDGSNRQGFRCRRPSSRRRLDDRRQRACAWSTTRSAAGLTRPALRGRASGFG